MKPIVKILLFLGGGVVVYFIVWGRAMMDDITDMRRRDPSKFYR